MPPLPKTPAGITLRGYQSGDWQSMYALDVECFGPPFRFSRRAMRSFAEDAHAITLLAQASAASPKPASLAGFAITHLEGQTAYIVTLDVAPAFRRRGLARLLMAETEARARAAGALETALHVFTGNSGAIEFYESLGYSRARMAEDFYARGTHALVYRKKL